MRDLTPTQRVFPAAVAILACIALAGVASGTARAATVASVACSLVLLLWRHVRSAVVGPPDRSRQVAGHEQQR
jgi:hypothetical protein